MRSFIQQKQKTIFMRIIKRQSPIATSRSKRGALSTRLPGSVHLCTLGILTLMFAIGGGYLYSVNRSAVQGYHMRTIENEINKLKEENVELKITEADLRSLYRIEASGEELQMQKLDNVKYLEKHGPVALR